MEGTIKIDGLVTIHSTERGDFYTTPLPNGYNPSPKWFSEYVEKHGEKVFETDTQPELPYSRNLPDLYTTDGHVIIADQNTAYVFDTCEWESYTKLSFDSAVTNLDDVINVLQLATAALDVGFELGRKVGVQDAKRELKQWLNS